MGGEERGEGRNERNGKKKKIGQKIREKRIKEKGRGRRGKVRR